MKSIIITGGNGGIGLACGRAFLSAEVNTHVFLGCREARDDAESLVAEFPSRCEILTLDVTHPDSWQQAVIRVLTVTKRIDVLVNNAGTHKDSLLATMSHEDWHSVIATNLTGTFLGCQAVVRTMLGQKRGRIVNIASLSALLAPAGQANYAAAKAGVIALTKSMAKEVARVGVTVNAVCPGYIRTKALGQNESVILEMAKRVPARRLGTTEEVASAVSYLTSDSASYVTGSILKIDGGIF